MRATSLTFPLLVLGLFVLGCANSGNLPQRGNASNVNVAASPTTPGQAASAQANASAAGGAISVNADDLFKQYETNEVAADAKYKGKTLAVTGTIDKIGKDILNTPYVSLKSRNPIMGVQCMFGEDQSAALAQLSPGKKITVAGSCEGKMGNVILRDCSIK